MPSRGNAATTSPALAASPALPDALSRLLARPDLRIAPHERSIAFAANLAEPFMVAPDGHIRLGPALLPRGPASATALRHALELALLLPRLPLAPALAALAAARVASLFATMHAAPAQPWHAAFAADTPPDAATLAPLWPHLARLHLQPPILPDPAALQRLHAIWPLLGPAELLLQTGGDQRLRVDPASGLNGYGCAHRPRPWAVTFASSTASSPSERGFAGAEAARQQVTLAALAGEANAALAAIAATIRTEIAQRATAPPASAVILAASGTDCELFARALAAGTRPLTTLLIAPEETGSGVPLAAIGCHFAPDTARGITVAKGTPIAGLPADTRLARIPARNPDGTLRAQSAIAADCIQATERALAEGRDVILHLLDISKTGYLAPDVATIAAIAASHPGRVRVVVDACQGRLAPARIAQYLASGWFVLLTGSKFLTGPPFAGAILVPPAQAHCLDHPLPAGLADYSSAPEWPDAAPAASALPARANYGLLLRWRAALAEWEALDAVPPAHQHAILTRFCDRIRQGIAANPDVQLLDGPPLQRPHHGADPAWDTVQTIMAFTLRPADPLDPDQARRVYHWLNADIRAGLPANLTAEQERLACLRCHIGQPVPLPGPHGRPMGVLRISAGARLVSGEPSHHDLDEEARLLREIRDALSVLAKISLILAHWPSLDRADPRPSF